MTPGTGEASTRWVRAGVGLELALDLPAGPHTPGSELVARLRFRNAAADPIRVYLLPEPFRNGTCTIVLAGGPAVQPSSFPPPRPHGHLPSEQDFPLIEPGGVLETTQTIVVPNAIGSVGLHWTYENHVQSWPGGVQTVDGPTQALFGGGPIPHIWIGKAEVLTRFDVAQ